MPEKEEQAFKSGFVAIVGRPNVGKSTLMNRIVGQKVAIMSDKAQTTRNKIQAVYTDDHMQIIFIDTPGIHKPKHELGEFMVKSAYQALGEVDAILMLVNVEQKIGPGDRFVMDKLSGHQVPKFLLVNKIDKVSKQEMQEFMVDIPEPELFDEIIPISAVEGANVDYLMEKLAQLMPEGPMYYPADQISDHPEYFIVSELIREQLLHHTREEIPHSIAVVVESMVPDPDQSHVIDVDATIIVERKSQKGIVIGKQGAMLKKIGSAARLEIEKLLGSRVYLNLWVKIEKDWRDKGRALSQFGYKADNY
ncbi:GTPase Era [Aerococcus urinaehominis]|uniref:GTPase Era n=1 Tax=Aerococcus urinaehominis TaxID=128944 RepID=A0A0X8FJK5_9LACT|nr:GTPase Era [Aerococcus urinaehominis]AMB98523.1 GTPase Era [Aerococcus urinaehominis]SDL79550.1 GTP-binding protein Era [Aerococcus urinaehominis]